MGSIILYAKISSIAGVPPTRLENGCNSVRHAGNMLVDISNIEHLSSSQDSCFKVVNSHQRMW